MNKEPLFFHLTALSLSPSPLSTCLLLSLIKSHSNLQPATEILNNPCKAPRKERLPARWPILAATSCMAKRLFQLNAGEESSTQKHYSALFN